MTTRCNKAETGFFPGWLLFAFGLLGLMSGWIPILTRSTIVISKFPVTVALLCGYCSLVVLLSSFIDHFDKSAAVGAYRLIGRWFMWSGSILAAFSVSLVASRTLYADDLLHMGKLATVGGLTAGLSAILAYFILRRRQADKPTAPPALGRHRRIKGGLAIVLCLAASFMLYQRYEDWQAREARFAEKTEALRRSAKPWTLEFDTLHGGQSVEELATRVRKEGHAIQCYSDLRSEERLREDDTGACWIAIGTAWGIPALHAAFAFSDEGLRNSMVRFPASSWSQVEQKLDQIGQRQAQTFGIDSETGGPVYGWRLNSGLVFSAPAPEGKELSVLWTAKIDIARTHCAYQGAAGRRDPQGYSVPVRALWPEIDCAGLHSKR